MDIGHKIKEKRILLQLTQEELANRCDLTKGYISQLENDKVSPSIETLDIILEVLGTNFSSFFHEEEETNIIFNKDEYTIKEFIGYQQTWLVPTSQEHSMEPIIVKIEPHTETFNDYPHIGEEFGYVIKGRISVVYGEKEEACNEHESFYIKTNKTHYIKNKSDKEATVLWVSCPPNF